ncbi:MAG: hypothetical protein JWQ90_455 [Hydrocarboniphaga sp.]|uniref:hypothetical protein n=1 Tax=Hydrocarboniphaga sp. TaxID=2033016 RepID=UPI00262005E3|nr:hypothetical protein [Hydrocarboniphaga sp.]MDB5968005.1 hypothetical protein [Hydrocarboniphaga sp.]
MSAVELTPGAAISPLMEAAWRRYLQGLEQLRQRIFATEMHWRPETHAAAHYFLMNAQASAFTTCFAPKQAYPTFYVHSTFEPNIFTWTLPNPDFHYRWAFIDGSRTYRIWGKRGSSLWLDIQVMRSHWCNDNPSVLGNYDADQVKDAEGNFEYILSAEPQPGKNWIKLDPSSRNNVVLVRDTHYDWVNTTAAEMHIELFDQRPAGPCFLSEAEMAQRLDGCLQMFNFVMDHFQPHITTNPQRTGINVFHQSTVNTVGGSNPVAVYLLLPYLIEADEALIIDVEIPQTMYWNIHLGDVWGGTSDYVQHQSCLNGAQAQVDADGRCRLVLSVADPGVPNWLDAIHWLHGIAQFRWYKTSKVCVPTVRRLKLAELRASLPAGTPTVTAEQRKRTVSARRAAVMRRYHY